MNNDSNLRNWSDIKMVPMNSFKYLNIVKWLLHFENYNNYEESQQYLPIFAPNWKSKLVPTPSLSPGLTFPGALHQPCDAKGKKELPRHEWDHWGSGKLHDFAKKGRKSGFLLWMVCCVYSLYHLCVQNWLHAWIKTMPVNCHAFCIPKVRSLGLSKVLQ